MKLSSMPIFQTIKAYAWVIVLVLTVSAFAAATVSAYRMGKTAGSDAVTVVLERERREHVTVALDASQGALKRSEAAAQAAREQQARDLESALKASEDRQAGRIEAAVRQGRIEAATRAPGSVYVDPKCVLDADTLKELQRAFK